MARKRHIVMAVTNDLVTDQRVHRTCSSLSDEGYDITLIGRRLPNSESVSRCYRTSRMKLVFRKGAAFYAEYNLRLFLKLMLMQFDMVWANDADTLLACALAARLKRKPLCFDAHELFTEVPELVGRDRVRKVWERIEQCCLPHVKWGCTVCGSIAEEYCKRYGVHLSVVRNVPMKRSRTQIKPPCGESLLLYQGAVNDGRGVDWMIDAMEWLEGCRFVVAGIGDEWERLKAYAQSKPWHKRIEFVGRLEPDQLFDLTQKADLGISLLANKGLSYYYSLPNRIADFVQAEVPILATDFPEIRNVVAGYGVGTLVEGHDAKTLADKVKDTLSLWKAMSADEKKRRFATAAENLDWEREKRIIVEAVHNIFTE